MKPWLGLVLCAIAPFGCKERGTYSAQISFPQYCSPPERFQVRLWEGQSCNNTCEAPSATCNEADGSCLMLCPDGGCPIAQLDQGLGLTPQRAGRYAVVAEVFDATGRTASTCEELTFYEDGTLSNAVPISFTDVTCCPLCCRPHDNPK